MTLAKGLSERYACHGVLTLGERGLVYAELGKAPWHLPAVAVNARDVCGAGDTVMAALGGALACGSGLSQACELATTAASQQVATVGITPPRYEFTMFEPLLLNRAVPRAVA